MSDYVVMVKEQAQVYLAGPPLVKMATGEESGARGAGRRRDAQRACRACRDYLAADEHDAIRHRPRDRRAPRLEERPPAPRPRPDVEPPRYDADELLGIASADDAQDPVRCPRGHRPHRRTARASAEFKPLYGPDAGLRLGARPRVSRWASSRTTASSSPPRRQQGRPVHRAVQPEFDVPLLFLQNITGFMVGKKYEQEGIIKHGAKLINAVSNSTVPAITIMTGASFGAGNYAMSGRGGSSSPGRRTRSR
jgi:acetyl-CoA carboxylase carboxyltransferase component